MDKKTPPNTHNEYLPLGQIIASEGWRLWLLFSLIFASYLISMPKTVVLEDDGLFIMSSYFLGIAHPPGYPLHTLFGHLFSQIPVGSVASRLHAMSGFFGALGCVLISLIIIKLLHSRTAAYTAALVLAWSSTYWSQAIIAEVYTLNAFLFLLILLLLLDAADYHIKAASFPSGVKSKLPIKIASISFFYGLSLTNHWPLMLLVSPCYLMIAWPLLKVIAAQFITVLICFLAGLTPYLWMFLYTPPPPEYAVMGPINNLNDLWFYLSRKGYSTVDNSLSAGLADKINFAGYFFKEALQQFSPPGGILALVGLISQWKKIGHRVSTALLVGFVTSSYLLIWQLNFDFTEIKRDVMKVYFIPSYCIMTIWLASGVVTLGKLCEKSLPRPLSSTFTLKFSIPVLLVLLAIILNANKNFRHYELWTKQYADILFSSIENDSVVFTDTDTTAAPLAYFHMIEGMRPDITLRNINGLIYANRLFSPTILKKEKRVEILQEYLRTEQKNIIFTAKPDLGYGTEFNGLYYTVKPDLPPHTNHYAINNLAVIDYLLNISSQPQAADKWTQHRANELITNAIPVFVSLYLNYPAMQEAAIYFIEKSSQSPRGKIMLIDALLGLNSAPPAALGDIDTLLKRTEVQLKKDPNKILMSNYYLLSAIHQKRKLNIEHAVELFRKSFDEWPNPNNPAIRYLDVIGNQKLATDQNNKPIPLDQ